MNEQTDTNSTSASSRCLELCERSAIRTFYCIYDREFGHWMSHASHSMD